MRHKIADGVVSFDLSDTIHSGSFLKPSSARDKDANMAKYKSGAKKRQVMMKKKLKYLQLMHDYED